jgi:hypothetical protein
MYGQKNYNELQGINGKYRINQIGCFVTSFSNLLERFGKGASPVQLNAAFRDRGIYVDVDDGIKDDLGWGSISAYNGNIAVARSANNSAVPSRNCIARIAAKNAFGTHFCLVDRIEGSTVYVVDSWDGAVKPASTYGPITGWAEYRDNTPIPVQPVVAPPPAVAVDYVVIAAQPGYGITHLLRDAGYTKPQWDNQEEWARFAQLNGTSSIQLGKSYKVYKAPLSAPQPAPAPAPEPDFINITVQSGWGLSHVLKAAGYNKEQWENPAEWARMSALNGVTNGNMRLQPNQIVKVNRTPLAIAPPTPPAPAPAVVAAPAPPQPAPAPVTVKVDQDPLVLAKPGWKTTFKPESKVYIAVQSEVIKDQAGLKVDTQLVKGQKVTGAGTFEKNGVLYVRTKKSVDNDWWYGIPLKALGQGQEPSKYVGPLVDDDDDDIFDLPLDLADEAKELYKNLTGRERLVAVVGRAEGLLLRIANFLNIFKKKTQK